MPRKDDYEKICERVAWLLAQERERQGISKTKLAAAAGLAQSAISYFEGNRRAPNLRTLLRISDALQLDLGKFIQRAIKDIRSDGR